MKERPILFSPPMIRQIVSDAKKQTRRVIKPQPEGIYCGDSAFVEWVEALANSGGYYPIFEEIEAKAERLKKGKRLFPFRDGNNRLFSPSCPYGGIGDRLWVRERFTIDNASHPPDGHYYMTLTADGTQQEFDYSEVTTGRIKPGKSYPSIFMPRWASRITLEITDVGIERVQEISEEDAIAEGVEKLGEFPDITPWKNYLLPPGSPHALNFSIARRSFNSLWDSINGKTHPWAANPWVWKLTFRRV